MGDPSEGPSCFVRFVYDNLVPNYCSFFYGTGREEVGNIREKKATSEKMKKANSVFIPFEMAPIDAPQNKNGKKTCQSRFSLLWESSLFFTH